MCLRKTTKQNLVVYCRGLIDLWCVCVEPDWFLLVFDRYNESCLFCCLRKMKAVKSIPAHCGSRGGQGEQVFCFPLSLEWPLGCWLTLDSLSQGTRCLDSDLEMLKSASRTLMLHEQSHRVSVDSELFEFPSKGF